MKRPNPEAIRRFWSRVEHQKEGCWVWTGAKWRNGYGVLKFHGRKNIGAHRFSWWVHYGDPGSLNVLHKCDNPSCIRPSHLFLGTYADNSQDMMRKGRKRGGVQQGEKNHRSKLTVSDVQHIRQSEVKSNKLEKLFGVSQSCISSIRCRLTWKHIPLEDL